MPPPISLNMLSPRAFGLSSTDNIQCVRPLPNEHGAPLFGPGSINLHQLMIYVSAPCLVLTIISCWFLSWRHVHRYTSPQEQRQILRIINLPIMYGVFNFLALIFTLDYQFIQPIAGIYEAFTVASLFFLLLEWVAPDGTDRESYFQNLELRNRSGEPQPGGSLQWFQRTWSSVLQYPLTKTVFVIIEIITQFFRVYCSSSWSPKHAHLWLQLADWFFIGGALGAAIRFFRRMYKDIAPIHNARAKMWSFIGIILFQVLQDLVFHLLAGKLFSPTKTATYNDINFGIASFMTCIEAVIFSLIFQWTYSSSEYKEGTKIDRYGTGHAVRTHTFRAVLDALNLSDITAGTILAFQMLFMRVRSRYGGSAPETMEQPQRQKTLRVEDQMHLEPLSSRQYLRSDYNNNNANGNDYVDGTQYNPGYPSPPPMPASARDPAPGRAQTFRADEIRPGHLARQDSHPRRGYARTVSPESEPLQQQQPRPMF